MSTARAQLQGCITDTLIAIHRTHLQDLIETTAQIHYEAFRSKQLLALKESSTKQQAQQAQAQWH